MPVVYIVADIESENVAKLRPSALSKRVWGLTLSCTRCHETNPNICPIDPQEQQERDGGTHNHVMSCKGCKHGWSISVVQPTAKDLKDGAWEWTEANKRAAVVAAFDVRGCEIASVHPDGEWIVENEAGTEFKMEWSEGEEFSEYEDDMLATISKLALHVKR